MKLMVSALWLAAAAYASGDELKRMLDPKASVAQRNDACFALRGDRSAEAIAALQRVLADSVVRSCAARGLREAGALDPLLEALASSDADVRIASARELGEMRDPRALQALGRTALDPNAMVASTAIDALAAYGKQALPFLLPAAEQPGVAGVTALQRAASFQDKAVLPIARRMLEKGDVASEIIALGVIGELGDASDLPKLREIAAKSEPVSSRGRGFGFMPAIDLARVAQNAVAEIQNRAE